MIVVITSLFRSKRTRPRLSHIRRGVKPLGVVALVSALVAALAPAVLAEESDAGAFVNRIEFEGNVAISSSRLKQQMRTREPSFFAIFRKPRLNPKVLERDVAHLEGYYHSIGYFEARVTLDRIVYSQDGRFADIFIAVQEGSPTTIRSVVFSENSLFDHKELRKGMLLKEGDAFNSSLLDTDIYTIKAKYFDRGYLGVAVVDSVRIDEKSVDLSFRIEPGTQISVRRIDIMGNTAVADGVIRKEFTFKPGEVCRLSKLIETQRNLFETGLFSVVDLEPVNLDPLERTVDITVRVRERKPAYVEVGFGVGNILGSRVLGEFGTRNLFGTGRTFRLKAEYAYDLFEGDNVDFGKLQLKNTYYRYDAELHQRRVFGTKQLVSLATFYEKDATVEEIEVKTLGASISTTRRFSRATDLILGLSSERIRRQVFAVPEETSTSRIASAAISHDLRDFILNPRTGSYRLLRVEGAGGILGGDNHFYTISASWQRYYRLSSRTVLAWRVRTGYADAFGDSRETGVPIENRFFAGGGNSVRGYEENSLGPRAVTDVDPEPVPVGGRVLMLTNVELRYPIPLLSRINISGALFVDGGNVWTALKSVKPRNFRLYTEDEIEQQDYRYSVGLGLRYNTPVGPIRVDFGIGVKDDDIADENGRFHINLGQIF